ncbi:hypothetical protein QR680_008323 [Steinernema hermaphroditum]|uniref:Uncharacterized protein n=1 Tax=Steinernema hermaphroditum TaxID=289476 RepID=A0AA39IIK9_9BILA|nr:hypothetical protein QR680_008323 [Steinernema hermaphroditum]
MSAADTPAKRAPEEVAFDPNHEMYWAPALCRLLHYRHGAVVAGFVEVGMLSMVVATIISWHFQNGLTNVVLAWSLLFVLVGACVTTIIMIIGIFREKPSYFGPELMFLQFEMMLLLIGAAVSIASMSFGIEVTHYLFSIFVSVHQMEDNFGPIWPFNVALLSFSGAAAALWSHILVKGCQDYLLDKQYFEAIENNKIEMKRPM